MKRLIEWEVTYGKGTWVVACFIKKSFEDNKHYQTAFDEFIVGKHDREMILNNPF